LEDHHLTPPEFRAGHAADEHPVSGAVHREHARAGHLDDHQPAPGDGENAGDHRQQDHYVPHGHTLAAITIQPGHEGIRQLIDPSTRTVATLPKRRSFRHTDAA
jgi:hypothetical protein